MSQRRIQKYSLPQIKLRNINSIPIQIGKNLLINHLQTLRQKAKNIQQSYRCKQYKKKCQIKINFKSNTNDNKQQKKLQNRIIQEKINAVPLIDADILDCNSQDQLQKAIIVKEIVTKIKPPHRYKTTMVGYQGKLLLYGGLGCQKGLKWGQIDLSTSKWKIMKEKIEFAPTLQYIPNTPIYGHTMTVNKQNAYIFGGMCNDITNDLTILNLKTKQFTIGPKGPFRRKQHTAIMLNKYMIIHGGIQINMQVKKDMFYYCTDSFKWQIINSKDLPLLSNHGMIAIQNKNKKKIKKFSDLTYSTIYIFGGKNQLGLCQNKLYKIKIRDQNQLQIQQINTNNAPQARHSFSMQLIGQQYILIYGGKQFNQQTTQNKIKGIYYDIHLFNINRQIWIKPQINQILTSRYSMASTSYNGKVFIFGGCNYQNYSNANIICLDVVSKSQNITNKNLEDIIDDGTQKENTQRGDIISRQNQFR